MKRMGVLGGISAQAIMDFEARVHRVAQRLVPQQWNRRPAALLAEAAVRRALDDAPVRDAHAALRA